MVFGIAAVNKFYDYYQTWGGMINDLTGQGVNSIPKYAGAGAGTNKQFDKDIGRVTEPRGRRPGRIPIPDLGHRCSEPPYP